ncbi:MAG: 1-(5-phosphoribosyl)-5-[(5-phosphoribosylamino)methylideneamino]imidazole-4-carboxamide isomerase [Pseudomonadota bacterium]
MLLIPAIDLKDGKCVRLKQGRMSDVTVFSDDPVAMARHWADQGCRRLHLVDLDGAFAGEPRNRDVIDAITSALPGVPVQVGGGIRSERVIESYLGAGVAQVIVGTRAVEEPEFLERIGAAYPGQVILGLDARDGRLAVEGWDATSAVSALEFAQWAGRTGIHAIVYTDIERDGMLSGLNVPATVRLAEAARVPIIASGGVTDLDDLRALVRAFESSHGELLGAITGRAIYAGTLDFRTGQRLLDSAD